MTTSVQDYKPLAELSQLAPKGLASSPLQGIVNAILKKKEHIEQLLPDVKFSVENSRAVILTGHITLKGYKQLAKDSYFYEGQTVERKLFEGFTSRDYIIGVIGCALLASCVALSILFPIVHVLLPAFAIGVMILWKTSNICVDLFYRWKDINAEQKSDALQKKMNRLVQDHAFVEKVYNSIQSQPITIKIETCDVYSSSSDGARQRCEEFVEGGIERKIRSELFYYEDNALMTAINNVK